MKSVSCKDMGGMNCTFVATGQTAQEVKDRMWAHASESHQDILSAMSEQDRADAMARMEALLA